MTINASKVKNNSRPKAPIVSAGTYPARLVLIADIGLQPQRPYKGKDKPPAFQMITTYELVDEFLKDEDGNDDLSKPRWQSETFTLHNLDAKLAKSTERYRAMDPTNQHDGDWEKLLGSPVMITIINEKSIKTGETYSRIAGVAPARPKDAAVMAPLVNPSLAFDMDSANVEAFNGLPEWVRKKISTSLEFKGSKLDKALGGVKVEKPTEDVGELDDDIPF